MKDYLEEVRGVATKVSGCSRLHLGQSSQRFFLLKIEQAVNSWAANNPSSKYFN